MTAAGVEQAALAREHAASGAPGPDAGATQNGDGEPTVRVRVPTGPAPPSAEERALHEASGHVPHRSWCQWCIAARRGQQPETDEAVPRIEFDFAELGREEDHERPILSPNAVDVGSESLSATLCPTKAFSEYLVETVLAFVEALGQYGNAAFTNRVINGICRAMWLSLENLLQEKLPSDSILIAWLIPHAAWSLTSFQVKNDGRTSFVRVFGKAYTGQVLPSGERVMYKYTAVPTGNLDQRRVHGIWVGKAPMTDEHIILAGTGVFHRVPPEERFVISELKKVRGLPWNGRAENLKATIVMQQDQAHRRVYLATKVVAGLGATPGHSGCVGLGQHTEGCRVRLEKALADERASAGPVSDRLLSLPLSPRNQHRWHSRSQQLHHPVLLRQCQHKTFRTSRWIYRWSWEHKNAESARERETPTSEISERPVVKARPASPPMLVPMAEGSGTLGFFCFSIVRCGNSHPRGGRRAQPRLSCGTESLS